MPTQIELTRGLVAKIPRNPQGPPMTAPRVSVKVLLFPSSAGGIAAQCMEYDLFTQARDHQTAKDKMRELLALWYTQQPEVLVKLPGAPAVCEDYLARAEGDGLSTFTDDGHVVFWFTWSPAPAV